MAKGKKKAYYNQKMANHRKGTGYAMEVRITDERGKPIFTFRPCNNNTASAIRRACEVATNKCGVDLFSDAGIILTDKDGTPSNIPESQKKEFENTVAIALLQLKEAKS
jgi:hypothetical protein